jgi:thiamine-monophosphate kinase
VPAQQEDGPAGGDPGSVAETGEFGLIDRVRAAAGTHDRVLIGPGDDAAHVRTQDGTYVVSTDLLVEHRHFRRDWSSAVEIGRKAAAANLSDVNAMGGTASALTVGLGVPPGTPSSWVVDLARGFEQEAALVGAHVVGGDMTASDVVVVAVTVIGDAPRPITRSGALPGDVVAVHGRLGWSAAGLAALSRGFRSPRAAVEAHRCPQPPYTAGPAAADAGATAMIDVSDGLLADLGHVATASGVVLELRSTTLAVDEPVRTVADALGTDPLAMVLAGGEDYALAATFSAVTELPPGWTVVGDVRDPRATEEPAVLVDGAVWEGDAGWQHWR